jgi:T1SS-143 domain-containing protein
VDEDGLSTNLLGDTGSATSSGSVSSLFKTGADKPLSFTLSTTTSNLPALTSGGVAVTYAVTSAGGVDTLTAKAGGTTVFTLALTESSGAWTFTLDAPIDQAPGASDASTTTLDFSSLITATDFDRSTATAPANAWTVTVKDDVPGNFTPEAITAGTNTAAQTFDNLVDVAGSTFTGDLTNQDTASGATAEPLDPYPTLNIQQHAGADGFGAVFFTGTNGSQLTGTVGGKTGNLQSNGKNIYLFGFGTANELFATTDSTGQGLPGGAGGSPITADEVFTIALDPANDQYTFNMLQPINNGSSFTFSDFADVPAGNYAWFSLPFNSTTKEPVSPGKSVVFTGLSPGVDTVNPSNIGVGSDSQAVTPGGAIRLDFVDNVHSIATTTDLKSLSTLGYADHYDVNNSGFTLSQVNPTGKTVDIRLDAFEVSKAALSPGGTFPSDSSGAHEAITEVKIVTEDSSGNVTGTLADFTGSGTKSFTNGGVSQSVTAVFGPSGDSNGVDVENFQFVPGEFVLVSTNAATPYDRLLATNIGSVYSNKDSFDMGAVSASTFNVGQNVSMALNLALQDHDAFHSSPGSLTEVGTGTLNINLTASTHA